MYQINMLYTLNLHKVMCQLYLTVFKGRKGATDNEWAKKVGTFCESGNLKNVHLCLSRAGSGRVRIQQPRF